MKTTVIQLAAGTFLAILLTVGTSNAKATEVKSSTETTITSTAIETSIAIVESTAFETALDIENWMMDEKVWDVNSSVNYEIVEAIETEQVIENLMISEQALNLKDNFIEEKDTVLIIQDWMTSETVWSIE